MVGQTKKNQNSDRIHSVPLVIDDEADNIPYSHSKRI